MLNQEEQRWLQVLNGILGGGMLDGPGDEAYGDK